MHAPIAVVMLQILSECLLLQNTCQPLRLIVALVFGLPLGISCETLHNGGSSEPTPHLAGHSRYSLYYARSACADLPQVPSRTRNFESFVSRSSTLFSAPPAPRCSNSLDISGQKVATGGAPGGRSQTAQNGRSETRSASLSLSSAMA